MKETTYKLTIAYDGTRFSGWQKQSNTDNTIQAILENALHTILGESVELIGASRTDAGVHSNGQAASFVTRKNLAPGAITGRLNEQLPSDIAVLRTERMPARFHARYNAKGKTYSYRIWNAVVRSPFHRKHSLWVPEPLDLDTMRTAADLLVGEHNFKAFSTGKTNKSTVKKLDSLTIAREGDMVTLTFCGNGFLYNMVRILAGTLIECGLHTREPQTAADALTGMDRQLAGYTTPPNGLFLEEVHY